LWLSAGSIWEIAIKVGLGKLTLTLPFHQWISQALVDLSLRILPIEVGHANALTVLPSYHRDPFDRLIIAQAMVEGIPVVSADTALDAYPVTRIW
jgi:PIN domain nuclease of toxin-antitoxin system